MKKIIGIVFISLMFANIGYAEMRMIEQKIVEGGKGFGKQANVYSTVCIDGHKFVIVRTGSGTGGRSISMVQFYEKRDGKSLPARC